MWGRRHTESQDLSLNSLTGSLDHTKEMQASVNHKGDIWDLPKPVAKLTCAFGRMTKRFLGNDLFPKKLLSWVERRRRRKTSSESGSGQGAWPELLRGSGADHRLVLAKC